jgi:hypothetical protein
MEWHLIPAGSGKQLAASPALLKRVIIYRTSLLLSFDSVNGSSPSVKLQQLVCVVLCRMWFSFVCTSVLPHSCSPRPLSMLYSCVVLDFICTLMQLFVQLCLDMCVVLFACLRLLVGRGKALGVTKSGLW